MPSEQYEQWKRDLFCHLERKLSGCVWCEIGKDRDAHPPTHRGRHGEPSQEIAWTCETMHAHAFDGLRGARVRRDGKGTSPRHAAGDACPT